MNAREWEGFAGFFADRGLIGTRPRRASCSPTSCCRAGPISPRRSRAPRARSEPPPSRSSRRRPVAGDRAVPAHEREAAGEAAERRVRGEVLLDLLDRGPAAEAGEHADQLHVGEVAGGQRVGLAAAAEPEDLDRPGPDPGDPQQAAVGRRPGGVDAARGDLAGAADQRDRPRRRQVEGGELGGRAAGDRRRAEGTSRSGPGPRQAPSSRRLQPPAPAPHDPALDLGRPARLDQLLGDRPGERLPGPRPALRAVPGPVVDRLADQRVAAEACARTRSGPRRRRARSACARRASSSALVPRCAGVAAGRAQDDPVAARLPGVDHDPLAVDVEQPREDRAPAPRAPRRRPVATAACTATAAAPRPRARGARSRAYLSPSRWTSTRNERLATTFVGRSRPRPERFAGLRPRRAARRADDRDRRRPRDQPAGGGKRGGADLVAPDRELGRSSRRAGSGRVEPAAGLLVFGARHLDRLGLQQLLPHPLLL